MTRLAYWIAYCKVTQMGNRPRLKIDGGIPNQLARVPEAARSLGAALARMEVNSFFSELLPRLKSIEMDGDPQFTATTFVGGLKHLPVRYSLV
jgi:hypothetical protein